jgi:hypothetical protein
MTTRPDTFPDKEFLGRPFKPVALGVTFMMLGLVAIPIFNLGAEGRDIFDWVAAGFALAAAGLLSAGWWTARLRLAEYGLAVATFAYLLRFTHLLIKEAGGDSPTLAFGVLVIIAGSYVLEANDRRVREWTP